MANSGGRARDLQCHKLMLLPTELYSPCLVCRYMQLVKKKKEKKLFTYDIFELIGFDFYNNQRVRSCFFVESYVDDTWMDNGLVYFSCVSDVTESLVFSKKFYNAVGVYDEWVLLFFVRQKFYYLSGYSGYEYNFLPRIIRITIFHQNNFKAIGKLRNRSYNSLHQFIH